jgi:hypothetical protein
MTKHNDETKKGQAQAAVEAALVVLRNKEAEASAALAAAEKQKADAEKKRADAVLFEIAGATGLVCRCRIPTAAVAQRGLFHILLGSGVTDVQQKDGGFQNSSFCFSDGTTCFDGARGNTIAINDTFYTYPSTSSGNTS